MNEKLLNKILYIGIKIYCLFFLRFRIYRYLKVLFVIPILIYRYLMVFMVFLMFF